MKQLQHVEQISKLLMIAYVIAPDDAAQDFNYAQDLHTICQNCKFCLFDMQRVARQQHEMC